MSSAAREWRDLSEDDIRAALGYINPECERDTWWRMAGAIKSELGANGFKMFDDWSATASDYDATATRDTYKSIKAHGGVTISTLIGAAMTAGFRFDEAERKPISQEEIDARQAKRDAEQKLAEEQLKKDRAEAAARAVAIFDEAADVEADEHVYLQRKGVHAFGLRVGKYRGIERALLIPIRLVDGSLVSLQAIFEGPLLKGRDRDYLWNGQKQNAFHMIGDKPSGSAIIILICEGYATGASAHMATGWPAAVAFDSSNLRNVAIVIREEYPDATIVILADDDRWHTDPAKQNAGVHCAHQAAQSATGLVAIPRFANQDSKPTDFNDLHQLQGLDAVRAQIVAALPKTEAANDNEPAYKLDTPMFQRGYPHQTDKGVVLNTWENLDFLLGQYGITAKYNQVRKAVEVVLPGRVYTLDNRANCSLAELTSIAVRNRMPQSNMGEYIKLIADKNAYNPVVDWVNSKPWDGVTRIQKLLETVRTNGDSGLKDKLMYRWLLSAVAAAFQPVGFEGHGCLVFTGAQGIGKTTWFRRLAPSDMRMVMVGATLDPADKDSVTAAVSHWIVELGELDATFRKSDIARLKSFIPKPDDKLRRPYDRVESEYQRRTIFCASVNDSKYLVDDTGNRRWWTIEVSWIDFHHDLDMQQVWAELLMHYQRGEQYHLTAEENDALGQLNEEHEAVDPVAEMISSLFKWDDGPRTQRMSASEVLLAIGFDKPTKAQATHATKVLCKMCGVDKPKKSGSARYFEMPPRIGRAGRGYPGENDDLIPL